MRYCDGGGGGGAAVEVRGVYGAIVRMKWIIVCLYFITHCKRFTDSQCGTDTALCYTHTYGYVRVIFDYIDERKKSESITHNLRCTQYIKSHTKLRAISNIFDESHSVCSVALEMLCLDLILCAWGQFACVAYMCGYSR